MPDLGWDIAETQSQGDQKTTETKESQENSDPHMTPSLQAIIAVIIMLVTILEHMVSGTQHMSKKSQNLQKGQCKRYKYDHKSQSKQTSPKY